MHAVLQELTLFGLTVETMKPIGARLYRDAEEGDPDDVFSAAMTDELKGYLALEFDVSSTGRLRLADTRIFGVGAGESEPAESNLPKARSTILIDLGAVASRIKWPAFGGDLAT